MSLLDMLDGHKRKVLRPSGGCDVCPRKCVDFVPATLRPTKVIYVGEGPGEKEVEEQEGFVGRSGELLRRYSAQVGITDFSLTNTVHCRPPKNATPKPKEISCCLRELVLDEIRGYPIVVMTGSAALQALFPGKPGNPTRATHHRGNIAYHPDFPGQRFYMIYHPAAVLRNPWLEEAAFRPQMERLGRIVEGEPPPDWEVFQGGGKKMDTVLRDALQRRLISFDLETTGLKSWLPHQHIRSIALTGDGKRAVFVHENEPHWTAVLQAVQQYTEREDTAVTGSNVAFDVEWMEATLEYKALCGVQELGVVWYQARQYKQPSLKELQSREGDGYRYLLYSPDTETDLTLLGYYNSEDVIYSYRLFRKGFKLLGANTRELVTRATGPVSLCFQEARTHGFYVRGDYRQKKVDEYTTQRRAAMQAWHKEDPQFVPTVHDTGKGLKEYLFKLKGLPVVGETDKGEPAVDKTAIKTWVQQYGAPYLKHLLEIRRIDKIKSTYLTAYDKHLDDNNRVHSSYTLAHTDTGRPSSRDPNLMNIPRVMEIRDLFGASNRGVRMVQELCEHEAQHKRDCPVLVEADLSQIEFRIMVCLAKDQTGINGYNRGDDAHTLTARAFTRGREPTKEERNRAKPVNFGLLYGGKWPNVQRQAKVDYDLDWSEELCKEFTSHFFSTYTAFPIFHQASVDRLLYNRGWFESVLGHVYYYKDWDSTDRKLQDHVFRSALNSEAQGPAAQIMFACMADCRRLLIKRNLASDVRLVNSVYDSAMYELSSDTLVAPLVECMEEAVRNTYRWIESWFVVPLVMDYKVGPSWGSMKDYDVTR